MKQVLQHYLTQRASFNVIIGQQNRPFYQNKNIPKPVLIFSNVELILYWYYCVLY